LSPEKHLIEEAEAVDIVAGNRDRIDMVRDGIFLRGLRSRRGEMIREAGGQMRPCRFRDGGTGTSVEA